VHHVNCAYHAAMILRLTAACFLLIAFGAPDVVHGQSRLTLSDAIARARTNNLDAQATASAEREAAARLSQARGGFLPKVDLAESWQRGDQPVFVFSSLLAQRQFAAGNFAIDALNHPAAIDNFQTKLTVEQGIFLPSTSAAVRSARIGHEIAAKATTALAHSLAVDVTDVYGRVLVAMASAQAANAALEAATADRERAANRRDAGRATDADVLQLDVYLARVREQQIRVAADERIARATLNQVMGEPLDAAFDSRRGSGDHRRCSSRSEGPGGRGARQSTGSADRDPAGAAGCGRARECTGRFPAAGDRAGRVGAGWRATRLAGLELGGGCCRPRQSVPGTERSRPV
jgi:outer membrane protein TolC